MSAETPKILTDDFRFFLQSLQALNYYITALFHIYLNSLFVAIASFNTTRTFEFNGSTVMYTEAESRLSVLICEECGSDDRKFE
jgi:hypothetical protein